MLTKRLTWARTLALALPLLLAGCGGPAEPIDPCKKLEKKIKGDDVADARVRALAFIERRKKTLIKQYDNGLKFGAAEIKCEAPEPPQPKPEKPKDPNKPVDPWKKKKPVKKIKATCHVVLPFCAAK